MAKLHIFYTVFHSLSSDTAFAIVFCCVVKRPQNPRFRIFISFALRKPGENTFIKLYLGSPLS